MLQQHEIELRVRYQETDPMGFLHHATTLPTLKSAAPSFSAPPEETIAKMEEDGMLVVVVKAECSFRRPAHYDDLLRLRTTIVRVTQAKIEHQYELFRDDESLAIGHVTLAVVDRNGKVQPVPEWMGRRDEG